MVIAVHFSDFGCVLYWIIWLSTENMCDVRVPESLEFSLSLENSFENPIWTVEGFRVCLLFYVQLSYHIFRDALFISVHFSVSGCQKLLVTPEIITRIYFISVMLTFCATRVSGHIILLASAGCIYTLLDGGQIDGRPRGANVVDCWSLRPLCSFLRFLFNQLSFSSHMLKRSKTNLRLRLYLLTTNTFRRC